MYSRVVLAISMLVVQSFVPVTLYGARAKQERHRRGICLYRPKHEVAADKNRLMLRALSSKSDDSCRKAVQYALDGGAPVDATDERGVTVLMFAAYHGYRRSVDLLLREKANVNLVDNACCAALYDAAYVGDSILVARFLASGALVNARTKKGHTALMVVCEKGARKITSQLLQAQADPNVVTVCGATALEIAVQNNHRNVARLLLSHGAKTNITGESGLPPLLIAADRGHIGCVDVLLKYKADVVMAYGDENDTALHFAADGGHKEMIEMLLDAGSDVNAVNKLGYTSLAIAAHKKHHAIARLLLERGAYVDARHDADGTALVMAVKNLDLEMVQLLLDHDANVHATNAKGKTSLMMVLCDGKKCKDDLPLVEKKNALVRELVFAGVTNQLPFRCYCKLGVDKCYLEISCSDCWQMFGYNFQEAKMVHESIAKQDWKPEDFNEQNDPLMQHIPVMSYEVAKVIHRLATHYTGDEHLDGLVRRYIDKNKKRVHADQYECKERE